MKYLLAAILAAACAWGGYWVWGAHATEGAIRDWLEARAAEGWVANYDSVGTHGFPNRFDTTIAAPELADPETGLAWSAPFLQFLSLSYKPHQMIVVWPEEQVLATPLQTMTLAGSGLRASLAVDPLSRMALNRTTIEGQDLRLSSSLDWQATASAMQLAARRVEGGMPSYDIALSLSDVTPPAFLARLAERAGLDPGAMGVAEIEGTAAFDAAWDLDALEEARPQPRRIELRRARAGWGELELQARGTLDIAADGTPEGEMTIRATNWKAMLQVARASGALNSEMAGLIEGGLNLVARMSGGKDAIDVPLAFSGGRMTLGGVIPLGAAPRIVLR
ncbi:DUF2125 domain-containing protein [Mangrovicoccus algicola]|uniref:DUF2125 domain-containing protein n=1 Tax=Mangrovicoccus algicola TaxID=2771008 RepID=A0A8J7CST7_9RHOB|nr:DUF2125 domain-containing protein [Mangrovicoccus algicola]MBE3636584.1 DUF2125 domain-containing protein [Mangrovicoccus algicola]